ncbi:MAG: hypothetical protein ABDH23_07430 [Endomicrobiia bacterium]
MNQKVIEVINVAEIVLSDLINEKEKLQKEIKKESVLYIKKEKIMHFLKKNLKGGEIVIFMGAGDIYQLARKIR